MDKFLSKLVGDDGVKIVVGVDFNSVAYLVSGILVAGILLIIINKRIIK